jgi:hypothetical protein
MGFFGVSVKRLRRMKIKMRMKRKTRVARRGWIRIKIRIRIRIRKMRGGEVEVRGFAGRNCDEARGGCGLRH